MREMLWAMRSESATASLMARPSSRNNCFMRLSSSTGAVLVPPDWEPERILCPGKNECQAETELVAALPERVASATIAGAGAKKAEGDHGQGNHDRQPRGGAPGEGGNFFAHRNQARLHPPGRPRAG